MSLFQTCKESDNCSPVGELLRTEMNEVLSEALRAVGLPVIDEPCVGLDTHVLVVRQNQSLIEDPVRTVRVEMLP